MLSCRKMKTCCTMGEKERGSEKEIVLSGILPISVQRFYTNKRQGDSLHQKWTKNRQFSFYATHSMIEQLLNFLSLRCYLRCVVSNLIF